MHEVNDRGEPLTHDHRRTCFTQEVAWGLAGLHLRGSSRTFVKLGVGYPENRVGIVVTAAMRAAGRDDAGGEDEEQSGSVLAISLIDSYRCRPGELHHLSLYTFASTQEVSTRPKQGSMEFAVGGARRHVFARGRPAVVRVYPRMSPEAHGAEYYYSMLLLHMPWDTDEENAIPRTSDDALEQQFLHEQPHMQLEHAAFADDMAAAVARLEALGSQEHGYGGVAPGVQQEEAHVGDAGERARQERDEHEWQALHPMDDIGGEDMDVGAAGVEGGGGGGDDVGGDAHDAHASVGQGRMTDEQWRQVQEQLQGQQRDVFDVVRRHMRDTQQ